MTRAKPTLKMEAGAKMHALIEAAEQAAHAAAELGYDPIEAVRALPGLLRAMAEGDLNLTQDRIASTIGRKSGQSQADFLRRAMERVGNNLSSALATAKAQP